MHPHHVNMVFFSSQSCDRFRGCTPPKFNIARDKNCWLEDDRILFWDCLIFTGEPLNFRGVQKPNLFEAINPQPIRRLVKTHQGETSQLGEAGIVDSSMKLVAILGLLSRNGWEIKQTHFSLPSRKLTYPHHSKRKKVVKSAFGWDMSVLRRVMNQKNMPQKMCLDTTQRWPKNKRKQCLLLKHVHFGVSQSYSSWALKNSY